MKRLSRSAVMLAIAAIIGSVPAVSGELPVRPYGPPVPAGQPDGLPINTEITLALNATLSSSTAEEGDVFGLTVVEDVRLGDRIVIPAGTQATGRVMAVARRMILGQPGKLLIELRSLDLPNGPIWLAGTHRQDGARYNSIGQLPPVAAAIGSLFVTGRSAVLPAGTRLKALAAQHVLVASADR